MSIVGDKDKILPLWNAIQASKFFAYVKPEPDYSKIKVEPAFPEHGKLADWWDWRVINWGSKWDVGGEDQCWLELSDDGTQIDGGFASAWSPPLPIYEQLLADGFAVKATYYEGGNAFCGVWDNGVDNHHSIPDFKSRTEINRWKQTLPEELLDIADNYSEFDESDQVSDSPFFSFVVSILF